MVVILPLFIAHLVFLLLLCFMFLFYSLCVPLLYRSSCFWMCVCRILIDITYWHT